jgi:hypothetical protein
VGNFVTRYPDGSVAIHFLRRKLPISQHVKQVSRSTADQWLADLHPHDTEICGEWDVSNNQFRLDFRKTSGFHFVPNSPRDFHSLSAKTVSRNRPSVDCLEGPRSLDSFPTANPAESPGVNITGRMAERLIAPVLKTVIS